MKLKTLKELWRYSHEPKKSYEIRSNTGNIVKIVKLQTLKEEAIKWINLEKALASNNPAEWASIQRWKERLNITEEDLK